jgi:hypothetical protein
MGTQVLAVRQPGKRRRGPTRERAQFDPELKPLVVAAIVTAMAWVALHTATGLFGPILRQMAQMTGQ